MVSNKPESETPPRLPETLCIPTTVEPKIEIQLNPKPTTARYGLQTYFVKI